MFDLCFSNLYFENLICKLNCLIKDNDDKDYNELARHVPNSTFGHDAFSPSLYEVAERFVIRCLRYECEQNPNHRIMCLVCDNNFSINYLARSFIVKFLYVYDNDHRSEFEFNARDFLRCIMTGAKPCELGRPSFDEYFSLFYDFVISTCEQRYNKL